MTRVTLERDGERYAVSARGHAPTRELCAAISCLLYTLAGWLRGAPDAEPVTERLSPGDARLVWYGGAGSGAVFSLMATGFLQLQLAAPEALQVEVREAERKNEE